VISFFIEGQKQEKQVDMFFSQGWGLAMVAHVSGFKVKDPNDSM
jgi:hypothetical protein